MTGFGTERQRSWRALIAIVAAYAVAAQSLLLILGGLDLASASKNGQPDLELCQHEGESAPALPAGNQTTTCIHCIFCFAGSYHAVIGARVVLSRNVDVEIGRGPKAVNSHIWPRVASHSIANPRGPPLAA